MRAVGVVAALRPWSPRVEPHLHPDRDSRREDAVDSFEEREEREAAAADSREGEEQCVGDGGWEGVEADSETAATAQQ